MSLKTATIAEIMPMMRRTKRDARQALTRMQEAGKRAHCPYWCRSNASDESAKDSEYSTVKYQAIGHLSIEEIAKKARENLAKRKESKNG